jgi:predicted nucleic acid-binding Zn ribbon protein
MGNNNLDHLVDHNTCSCGGTEAYIDEDEVLCCADCGVPLDWLMEELKKRNQKNAKGA